MGRLLWSGFYSRINALCILSPERGNEQNVSSFSSLLRHNPIGKCPPMLKWWKALRFFTCKFKTEATFIGHENIGQKTLALAA